MAAPTTSAALRPRRSALYMPGSNVRAMEKAKTLGSDVVIFDLEDAVAPDAKATARAQVVAAVKGGGFGHRELVIRINGLDSPWGRDDLSAAASANPHAVLVPKVSTPDDLHKIGAMLVGAPATLKVWAMMETPLGVLNARDIAAAARVPSTRLACFVIGTNDLVKETRAHLDEQRTAGLYWLSTIMTAAKAYGLDCLDGVYNDFKDLAGLERESVQGRSLGMDGKTLIHPDQIAITNRVFAPSADELAKAQAIIAAFARPENAGKGVITMDGRMVELLHAEMARRTVAVATAIAAMD
jgi:citrate lyase subunit beta / citryl-CoA lyase